MPKMTQIRNVPDIVHRELKARAAAEGVSMSDFILRELERVLSRPTRAEVLRRIRALPETELEPSAVEILREAREGR
jgi:plasmid stability protein